MAASTNLNNLKAKPGSKKQLRFAFPDNELKALSTIKAYVWAFAQDKTSKNNL